MPAPFENFSGVAAPLAVRNINTDAIIPAPYLRDPDADLAHGLFARWRYGDLGAENPDFVLNRPPFREASILLGGENFGCGSSREAAAWALKRFGIRCVVAPSFADIFYENAFRNGLLPAIVEAGDLARAAVLASANPAGAVFAIDLPAGIITGPDGSLMAFRVPEFRRQALLAGDDDIAMTLRFVEDIARFTGEDRVGRPWIYAMEGVP